MSSLTFAALRAANLPRCRRWHPEGAPPWTFDDWLLALGGEVGEALNVVKKLNRDRDGLAGNTRTREELIADLASELADVVIYLDITLGWDQPEELLGDDRGYDAPLTFHGFRGERKMYDRGSGLADESCSRMGNRLLNEAGRILYPPASRHWANFVLAGADRLADHFGIDLGEAVVTKFNATSDRFGFPERLAS